MKEACELSTNSHTYLKEDFFRQSLGIASYFRGVLLLNPEVLIVVDSIKLRPGSKTTMASTTFHNMLHPFKPFKYQMYEGKLV